VNKLTQFAYDFGWLPIIRGVNFVNLTIRRDYGGYKRVNDLIGSL
jgi:hypothetical protein